MVAGAAWGSHQNLVLEEVLGGLCEPLDPWGYSEIDHTNVDSLGLD